MDDFERYRQYAMAQSMQGLAGLYAPSIASSMLAACPCPPSPTAEQAVKTVEPEFNLVLLTGEDDEA